MRRMSPRVMQQPRTSASDPSRASPSTVLVKAACAPGRPELPFDGALECLTEQVPGAQPHRERRVVACDEILDPGPMPDLRGLGLARPEVAEQHHGCTAWDSQDLDLVEVRREGGLIDLEGPQTHRPARPRSLLKNTCQVIRAQRCAGPHELEKEVPQTGAALLRPTLTQRGSGTVAERRRNGRVGQLDEPQCPRQVVIGGRPLLRRGRQRVVEPFRQRRVDGLDRSSEFIGRDRLEPLPVDPPPAREIGSFADPPRDRPPKRNLAGERPSRGRSYHSKDAPASS